jgi:hypothetical protein
LRSGDTIGSDELLRREAGRWLEELTAVIDEFSNRVPPTDEERRAPIIAAFLRAVERRLASLLPLAMHDGQRFRVELDRLSRVMGESARGRGGYTAWTEMAEFAAAWVGYVCGALLVGSGRLEDLQQLVDAAKVDDAGYVEPLVWLFGGSPFTIGELLAQGPVRAWVQG